MNEYFRIKEILQSKLCKQVEIQLKKILKVSISKTLQPARGLQSSSSFIGRRSL